jgi:3-methylcrotonyl-CoA carboxylase beta subunit
MSVIESTIDRGAAEFAANGSGEPRLAEKLRALIRRVERGGSAAARAARGRGKMFVRDRVDRLLDRAPFLEIGSWRATSSTTTGCRRAVSLPGSAVSAASSA